MFLTERSGCKYQQLPIPSLTFFGCKYPKDIKRKTSFLVFHIVMRTVVCNYWLLERSYFL
jgi:hypothetical protein